MFIVGKAFHQHTQKSQASLLARFTVLIALIEPVVFQRDRQSAECCRRCSLISGIQIFLQCIDRLVYLLRRQIENYHAQIIRYETGELIILDLQSSHQLNHKFVALIHGHLLQDLQ